MSTGDEFTKEQIERMAKATKELADERAESMAQSHRGYALERMRDE